jgi:hypothetical protein
MIRDAKLAASRSRQACSNVRRCRESLLETYVQLERAKRCVQSSTALLAFCGNPGSIGNKTLGTARTVEATALYNEDVHA